LSHERQSRWPQQEPIAIAATTSCRCGNGSQWCVGIYPTRADLPILPRSTLSTMAPQKEVVVEEAKQKIDRILARLNYWKD
jgi:hypothetical protein